MRRKVGAAVVTPTGMISIGWNGMPAGLDNVCEREVPCEVSMPSLGTKHNCGSTLETRPEVIHAERNAIDKMTRQGVPIAGSVLFVTTAPCLECAKSIHGLGFSTVYYDEGYRCDAGITLLKKLGIPCIKRDETRYAWVCRNETAA